MFINLTTSCRFKIIKKNRKKIDGTDIKFVEIRTKLWQID